MRVPAWKRAFLATLIGAMAVAGSIGEKSGAAAATGLPLSTVAIVRADRASVYSVTGAEIRKMVRTAVALAGGLGDLIASGDTVVIKPNLVEMRDFLGERHPLPGILGGVATDWRVVAAVAELAHEAGAGKIYVMEGSANPTDEAFRYYGYSPANIPYVDAFIPIETDSGGWMEIDSPRLAKVDLPDGRYRKVYFLNRRYYEADVVISVPTLKNHASAVVTGAVKNLSIGATPANIYGLGPKDYLRARIPHDNEEYHYFLRDYYKCRPAQFAVMDGLVGIQHGPTPNASWGSKSYAEDCMNMRCILASRDPVALDAVEALVTGWDPETIKYLRYLGADGLGNADPARILVEGRGVAEVRRDFGGKNPPAGGRPYRDHDPPSLTLVSAEAKDGRCLLSLEAPADTVRVELFLDGERAGIFLRDFRNLSADVSSLGQGEHRLRIVGYDRFLNGREIETELTVE
ncbi:MAG: DUF362 domain-containing protein [Bacteroidota bacterium]